MLSLADKVISCWHEIPLWAGEDELHFICEIPKESAAKMEVATVSKQLYLHRHIADKCCWCVCKLLVKHLNGISAGKLCLQ